jgi:hypothetical protein
MASGLVALRNLPTASGSNVGFDPGSSWHVIPQHHDVLVESGQSLTAKRPSVPAERRGHAAQPVPGRRGHALRAACGELL